MDVDLLTCLETFTTEVRSGYMSSRLCTGAVKVFVLLGCVIKSLGDWHRTLQEQCWSHLWGVYVL